jgi:hypothetical protein
MFEKERKIAVEHLDRQLVILERFCTLYPNVGCFVKTLLYTGDSNSSVGFFSSALKKLVWEISLIDFATNIDGFCFDSLNNFIGNYFLDDAYFTVCRNEHFPYLWKAKSSHEGSHNPLLLIESAKDNARFYYDCARSPDELEAYRRGMVSSGNVEKLLILLG